MVISFKNASVLLIFYCLPINVLVLWISEYEPNVTVHFNIPNQKFTLITHSFQVTEINEVFLFKFQSKTVDDKEISMDGYFNRSNSNSSTYELYIRHLQTYNRSESNLQISRYKFYNVDFKNSSMGRCFDLHTGTICDYFNV